MCNYFLSGINYCVEAAIADNNMEGENIGEKRLRLSLEIFIIYYLDGHHEPIEQSEEKQETTTFI